MMLVTTLFPPEMTATSVHVMTMALSIAETIYVVKIYLIYRCKDACNFVLVSKQHLYQTVMLHSFSLLIIASHSISVCTYQGTVYDVGDTTIPAGDDCNVCTCNDDGNVVCGNDICGK